MMMTSEWTAARIAKQHSHDLMRAATQRRVARDAGHISPRPGTERRPADLAAHVRALGLCLSSARRPGSTAWGAASDDG